jgi:hypothetical protein
MGPALRPLQVVLSVGAVLVVAAGADLAAQHGGTSARLLLLALAAGATALSLRAHRGGLRNSAETFAACAVGLSLAGAQVGPTLRVAVPLALASAFLLLRRWAPDVVVWPLAAWFDGQIAALRALPSVPASMHMPLFLGVALVGLSMALSGRPLVARIALITNAPWWVAGVVTGTRTAWTGFPAERWTAAGLLIGAGAGLVLVRLRRVLDPFTGPPRAIPVVSGCVAGAGLAGAFAALGVAGTTAAAYLAVLLVSIAAAALDGWPRGLLLPIALAGGGVVALLSVGRLLQGHHWAALSLLLFLTAAPSVLVAARRREDRPVAAPVAVGCLTGSILLALPGGLLTPTGAGVLLTVLYAMATLAGPDLEPGVRQPTEATAAVAGAVAVVVLAAHGEWGVLSAVLAVQGACTIGWAWRARPGGPEGGRVWPAGSAQLVLAAWLGATTAGVHVLEAYTLPAAAGLLLAAGPRLGRGASWPAWGPGLLVAAVPSTLLGAVTQGSTRPVVVLLAAAAAMLAGARSGLRAPLMVGAGTAVAVGLALSVTALPWPVTAALALGAVLLAVGARRERSPVAFFGYRLADLR